MAWFYRSYYHIAGFLGRKRNADGSYTYSILVYNDLLGKVSKLKLELKGEYPAHYFKRGYIIRFPGDSQEIEISKFRFMGVREYWDKILRGRSDG